MIRAHADNLFDMTRPRPSRSAQFRTWAKDTGPLLITVAGLATYLAMRLPAAWFYSRLGTTLEELDIGYTQLLSSSIFGVITFILLLAGAFLWAAVNSTFSRWREAYSLLRGLPSNFDLSDEELREALDFYWEVTTDLTPEIITSTGLTYDELERRAYRIRELERKTIRTTEEDEELDELGVLDSHEPISLVQIPSLLISHTIRMDGWRLLLRSILPVLIVLTFMANHDAHRVRAGNNPTFSKLPLFAFRATPVRVAQVKNEPASALMPFVSSNDLYLLGRNTSYVILFDSKQHHSIRIPSTEVIITSR